MRRSKSVPAPKPRDWGDGRAGQVELARKHSQGLERVQELARLEKRRMRMESLRMGAVFALFGVICSGLGLEVLLVSTVLGTALGWVCSRLDAGRLSTAALG